MTREGHQRSSILYRSMAQIATTFDDRFELIDIDTLFYVDNHGLTRILVDLNGYPFKLVVDSLEVRQSDNAFLMPLDGEITVSIAAYIRRGDANFMKIASQGPEGSFADLLVGDLLLPGQTVAYAIENIRALPEVFDLLQNYPNPFGERTTIVFKVPDRHTNGVSVSLWIYDVLGRRIRVLVDEWRYPGTFTMEWDGTGDHGRFLGSGVYLCHLVAGEFRETIRIVHSR